MLRGVKGLRGSEVYNLDFGVSLVLVYEQVFGLKVSVDNVSSVAVVYGGDHLLHNVGGIALAALAAALASGSSSSSTTTN